MLNLYLNILFLKQNTAFRSNFAFPMSVAIRGGRGLSLYKILLGYFLEKCAKTNLLLKYVLEPVF